MQHHHERRPFPSINRFFGGDIRRSLALLATLLVTSVVLAVTSQVLQDGSVQHWLSAKAARVALVATLLIIMFDFVWILTTLLTLCLTMHLEAGVETTDEPS